MAVITAAQVLTLTDKLAAAFNLALGTTEGWGDTSFGVTKKMADLLDIVTGSTDASFRDAALQLTFVSTVNVAAGYTANQAFGALYAPILAVLSQACAGASGVDASISDLKTFLTYYNYGHGDVTHTSGDYWNCLLCPDFYYAYAALTNGTRLLDPKTIGFEIKKASSYKGTTYTNGLGKKVAGGAFTAGGAVDRTKFAGGLPYIVWDTCTSAANPTISVAGKDQDGNVETYTFTQVGALGATGTGTALVPATHAWNLITEVTGVTLTNISAGNFYVESRLGRTNPPA